MSEYFLGVVINPAKSKPVLVTSDDEDVVIYRMDKPLAREGSGGLETAHDDPAYNLSGLPRTHTPSGVTTRGQGYGTALYTGLCLLAHASYDDEVDAALDDHGDGVASSEYNRSSSASRWWERAVDLGVADEVVDDQEDEYVDVSNQVDADDLERCGLQLEDGGRISHINRMDVDVVYERRFQIYPYDGAARLSLVAAYTSYDLDDITEDAWKGLPKGPKRPFSERREPYQGRLRLEPNHPAPRELRFLEEHLWRAVVDDDSAIQEVDTAAIVACDVRGLTEGMYNLLSALAQFGEASEDDLASMRLRWEYKLDPSMPVKQMRLPFTPNAAERREIKAMLDETGRLRHKLGWDKLAGLP